jgi:hypothetical protein
LEKAPQEGSPQRMSQGVEQGLVLIAPGHQDAASVSSK